jgi:hypothetical protein
MKRRLTIFLSLLGEFPVADADFPWWSSWSRPQMRSSYYKCLSRSVTNAFSETRQVRDPRRRENKRLWCHDHQEVRKSTCNLDSCSSSWCTVDVAASSDQNWHHDKSEPGREKDGGISKL